MKDINLFKAEDSLYLKVISGKSGISKSDSCDGYLIKSSESEARRIIESLKGSGKVIAVQGKDDKFNRRALETLKIDFLVSVEAGKRLDTLKQRDSGLNHVLGKIAAKKNVGIVVNMNEVSKLKGRELALRLSRIMQNVKVCRREKCKLLIASFGKTKTSVVGVNERGDFGRSIGMSSQQVKGSTRF